MEQAEQGPGYDNTGSKPKVALPDNEFRLGITMAGAASAGCYTAGVMDYLFEVLHEWEKAKKDESRKHEIPQHKVIIDALGGTSAGGMTAVMTAIYALHHKVNPVSLPPEGKQPTGNLFYDSWVLMNDDTSDTFKSLWNLDDLKDNKIESLLNSGFIDEIADRCFPSDGDLEEAIKAMPSFICKDLQLLLSHSFLRGIPLEVNFETSIARYGRKSIIPNHTTYEHFFTTQYHLNGGKPPNPDQYSWLNPFDKKSRDLLQLATKATGAFPVGLQYREFSAGMLNPKLIQTIITRIASQQMGLADPSVKNIKIKLPEDFSTIAVDGGAINNEPYREVMSLLQNSYSASSKEHQQFGVIMIDPFPDRAQSKDDYSPPEDLLDVIPSMLSMLVDQTRVKRRELLEAEDPQNFRSIIFPRKWEYTDPERPDKKSIRPVSDCLASSSAMAFGGLLDISLRQHDYFLGRDNARNFIRWFFTFPYDKDQKGHPIHKDWTDNMIERFHVIKDGKMYLPIIPDMNLFKENATASTYDRLSFTIPYKPKIDAAVLFSNSKSMTKRWIRLMEILKERDADTITSNNPLTTQYMKKKYPTRWYSFITAWLGRKAKGLAFFFFKKRIAKSITRTVIERILKDVEKTGYLK